MKPKASLRPAQPSAHSSKGQCELDYTCERVGTAGGDERASCARSVVGESSAKYMPEKTSETDCEEEA